MDPDPELFVPDPDPAKNEKTDKNLNFYFFFALIVQKLQQNVPLKVGLFFFQIDYKFIS